MTPKPILADDILALMRFIGTRATALELSQDADLNARDVQDALTWLTTEDGGSRLMMRNGIYRLSEKERV